MTPKQRLKMLSDQAKQQPISYKPLFDEAMKIALDQAEKLEQERAANEALIKKFDHRYQELEEKMKGLLEQIGK